MLLQAFMLLCWIYGLLFSVECCVSNVENADWSANIYGFDIEYLLIDSSNEAKTINYLSDQLNTIISDSLPYNDDTKLSRNIRNEFCDSMQQVTANDLTFNQMDTEYTFVIIFKSIETYNITIDKFNSLSLMPKNSYYNDNNNYTHFVGNNDSDNDNILILSMKLSIFSDNNVFADAIQNYMVLDSFITETKEKLNDLLKDDWLLLYFDKNQSNLKVTISNHYPTIDDIFNDVITEFELNKDNSGLIMTAIVIFSVHFLLLLLQCCTKYGTRSGTFCFSRTIGVSFSIWNQIINIAFIIQCINIVNKNNSYDIENNKQFTEYQNNYEICSWIACLSAMFTVISCFVMKTDVFGHLRNENELYWDCKNISYTINTESINFFNKYNKYYIMDILTILITGNFGVALNLLSSKAFGFNILNSGLSNLELYILQNNSFYVSVTLVINYFGQFLSKFIFIILILYDFGGNGYPSELFLIPIIGVISNFACIFINYQAYKYQGWLLVASIDAASYELVLKQQILIANEDDIDMIDTTIDDEENNRDDGYKSVPQLSDSNKNNNKENMENILNKMKIRYNCDSKYLSWLVDSVVAMDGVLTISQGDIYRRNQIEIYYVFVSVNLNDNNINESNISIKVRFGIANCEALNKLPTVLKNYRTNKNAPWTKSEEIIFHQFAHIFGGDKMPSIVSFAKVCDAYA